jgi:hypothetical protein
MSDTVAITGIVVAGLVIGAVAIIGIVFGMPVRSKVNRDGFELSVESPEQADSGDPDDNTKGSKEVRATPRSLNRRQPPATG